MQATEKGGHTFLRALALPCLLSAPVRSSGASSKCLVLGLQIGQSLHPDYHLCLL